MEFESLSPGMQHCKDSEFRSQALGIGGNAPQRIGDGAEQNPINHLLVLIGNGGDLSGDAEHYVKILHRQQVGLAAFQPLRFGKTLTLVAMPVPAGVVTDTAMPAGIAFFYMAAQRRCSTHFYGMHHGQLLVRERATMPVPIARAMLAEDIRQLQRWASHCADLV